MVLSNLCKDSEREISEIVISLRATVCIGECLYNESGERIPLTGSLDQIKNDINNYQDCGLDYLVISMAGDSINKVVDSVNLFSANFLV